MKYKRAFKDITLKALSFINELIIISDGLKT
jgi:hypothetical protein